MKTYTWEEVSKHNGRNGSYWVVIHGSVHDLSPFLDEHPGGDEVLMNLAGKDGTACFDEVGHSDDAKNLCKKFKIGIIAEHPGGEEVLLEQAGKDGTESFEDVGHSTDAREMMSKYKIGELIEADRRDTETKKSPSWSSANPEEYNSKWRSWLIPLAFGIVATIVFRFFLKQ